MRVLATIAFACLLWLLPWSPLVRADDVEEHDLVGLRKQVEEMRARLRELEAFIEATRTAQEETKQELKGLSEAHGKLVREEKVRLSGYIQNQYTSNRAGAGQAEFRVRRARLKVEAPASKMAALTLQIDAARAVELKDAYLDLGNTTGRWRLRIGQAKVPFMYEVLESSSNRLEPERSALAGALFPGERDIGAWVHFKHALGDAIPGATLDLGFMNGNGPGVAENDDNRSLVARLRFVLGHDLEDRNAEANSCYLGFLSGKHTAGKPALTTDRRAVGAGVSDLVGRVWLRAEWLTGENAGKDITGWYAHAACQLPSVRGTLFARYERYDENKNVPDCGFANLTLGYEHQLDNKARVVLARELRHPDPNFSGFASSDGPLTTVRFQVKY